MVLRIDRLSLFNFRSFQDATLDLEADLTLLVADNGGGKTAVLDAAAIMLGSILSSEIARRIERATAPTFAPGDANTFDVGDRYREQRFPVSVEATGLLDGQQAQWGRQLTRSGGRTTTATAQAARMWGDDLVRRTESDSFTGVLPVIAYYGTGRVHRDLLTKGRPSLGKTSRLAAYSDCLGGSSNFRAMVDWTTRTEFDAVKSGSMRWRPTLDCIYGAVLSMLEPLEVSWVGTDLELGGIAIRGRSGLRSITELSDGYRAILALVADLAWRCGLLNSHLGARAAVDATGIVLIDELDMHLHPSWQARVLPDLSRTFPNIQFVVTTHSPFLVGSVREKHLRRLVRTSEGVAHCVPVNVPTWGRSVEYLLETVLGGPVRASVPPAERLAELGEAVAKGDVDTAEPLAAQVRADLGSDVDAVRTLRAHDRLVEDQHAAS